MRSFLAVTVAEPALSAVLRFQDALRAQIPDVRWARPEGIHITLRFFEHLDGSAADPLVAAVRRHVIDVSAFGLSLAHLGGFPSLRRPRVLWLGVGAGGSELATVFERVDQAADAAGQGREERPFRAHCTLGRPRLAAEAGRQASSIEVPSLPAFTVRSVDLYEVRDGYHVIATAPLAT